MTGYKSIGLLVVFVMLGTPACSTEKSTKLDNSDKARATVEFEPTAARAAFSESVKRRPLTGSEMATRADSSFSSVLLGVHMDSLPKFHLKKQSNSVCETAKNCDWIDHDKILYGLDSDGRVATKSINISAIGSESLNVLGLGTARKKAEVIAAVKRFLPNVNLECFEASDTQQIDSLTSCVAALGPEQMTLNFNSENVLIDAKVGDPQAK